MEKTGFNPAFYHAASVSPQQQARNNQPHILYLAHFAPGIMKVGISWKQRGIRRLLEQGARGVIILGTYPTADAAREKEAAIARETDIAETIQLRHKLQHLQQQYDIGAAQKELLARAQSLAEKYDLPKEQQAQHLDDYYFPAPPQAPIDLSKELRISGTPLGMLGGILLFTQGDQAYSLPIHKLKATTLPTNKPLQKTSTRPYKQRFSKA
jgi:hypothetical protein